MICDNHCFCQKMPECRNMACTNCKQCCKCGATAAKMWIAGIPMTPFTDEDLRVLKGMCEAANWPIGGKALLPLLARLEAAEKVCKVAYKIGGYSPLSDHLWEAYEAWCKAAGK